MAAEDEERSILSWLLTRQDFADALDFASDGRQKEATDAAVAAIQALFADHALASPSDDGDLHEPAASEGAEEVAGGGNAGKRPSPELEDPPPAKRLTPSALDKLPATFICVIAVGLPGCGKSSLCHTLREVLGGTWLNMDESNAKKAEAGTSNSASLRKAFSADVRGALNKCLGKLKRTADSPFVFIDRCNAFKKDRADVMQELQRVQWRKRGGKTLLVDFTHESDTFGYGSDGQLSKRVSDQHVALCAQRVEHRGSAHHALHPSAKLRPMLQTMAKGADPPAPEEVAQYDGRVSVNVALPVPGAAHAVLERLRALDWVPKLPSDGDLQSRAQMAWQAYARAEQGWRDGAALDATQASEWAAECRKASAATRDVKRRALEVARARASRLEGDGDGQGAGDGTTTVTWKMFLPEVSNVLSQKVLPADIVPVKDPHVVLLRVAPDGTARSGLSLSASELPTERVAALCEALEALEGEELSVSMSEIFIEDDAACGIIELSGIVPCGVQYPHVLLGAKKGTSEEDVAGVLAKVKAGGADGAKGTTHKMPKSRPLRGILVAEKIQVEA